MEAVVTYAGFVRDLDWPVDQRWVFRDNTWFLIVEASRAAIIFGGGGSTPTSRDDEPKRRIVERALRRFEMGSRVRFDEVRQGQILWREISYRNGSDLPVSVRIDQIPPWVGLDHTHFTVEPGQHGTLLLGVFTEQLEGEIRGKLSVVASYNDVEVSRQLDILGVVTAPIAIVPHQLILGSRLSHRIRVHNTTDQQVEIDKILSSADFIQVQWPSGQDGQILGPQSSTLLEMTWDPEGLPEQWMSGWIELVPAQPVEGHSSWRIQVVRRFP